MQKKRVVVIGGGTGTHTVLQGLKSYQAEIDITAIVTMADSGGSTGRLRDEFGYLPVGDVRMALAALASDVDDHEELLRELFLYRFDKGEGLSGHNFGNLFLVALTDILGSEAAAIAAAARVLRVRGSVLPVTEEPVDLVAQYAGGEIVTGEHEIDEVEFARCGDRIKDLWITPAAAISPAAREALMQADMIILGPGDLYTSLLANVVVDGVAEAIRHSKASFVYISNLMTKCGQTADMGVQEHVHELERYIGRSPDILLVNTTLFPDDLKERYATQSEFPVVFNYEGMARVVPADLLATEEVVTASGDHLKRSFIRHDSHKVAAQIMKLL